MLALGTKPRSPSWIRQERHVSSRLSSREGTQANLLTELYGTTAASKLIYWSFIPLRDGAISSLYALTSPEVEDKKLWGAYLVPHAKVKSTTKYGKDATLARQLWDLCEALCRA